MAQGSQEEFIKLLRCLIPLKSNDNSVPIVIVDSDSEEEDSQAKSDSQVVTQSAVKQRCDNQHDIGLVSRLIYIQCKWEKLMLRFNIVFC